MTSDPPGSGVRPLPVDVVVPAWGSYVSTLEEAVASVPGTTVYAVVEPADEGAAAARGCWVVPRPPGGIGPARNAGAAAGTNPFVLFLDADDRLLPGALDRLVDRLRAAPDRCPAVAGELRRRSDGSAWPPRGSAELCCSPGGGPVLLWRNVLPAVGATLVRRRALPPEGLFPDLEDEDWHAVVRLRSTGRVRLERRPTLDYQDRAGSVSRRSRDRDALLRSHGRLADAARHARSAWVWRAADRLAAPHRRRNDELLLSRWGETGGLSGPRTR